MSHLMKFEDLLFSLQYPGLGVNFSFPKQLKFFSQY